jgi:uncharacterized protein with ATP-grasp and redox domains
MEVTETETAGPFLCDSGFAQKTVRERLPSILDRLLSELAQEQRDDDDGDAQESAKKQADRKTAVAALCALRESLTSNAVIPRCEGHGLALPWHAPWHAPWSAQRFLDAEVSVFGFSCLFVFPTRQVLFYFALLEAWGFFSANHSHFQRDPFRRQKEQSFAQCEPQMRQRLAESGDLDLEKVLLCSFWGNKTDLSLHSLQEARVEISGNLETILANDLRKLTDWIGGLPPDATVDIIADNYCFELFNDLLLARFLLRAHKCRCVTIHVKRFPVFVSDATRDDAVSLLRWTGMENADSADSAIVLREDAYWNSQHEWADAMPDALVSHFKCSNLSIVKGDANYRKLVRERRFPVDKPFAETVSYFPCAAVAALRGVKCELVVGVDKKVAEQLWRGDAQWTNSGTYGVIHFARRSE